MQRGESTSTDEPDGGIRAEVAAAPRGGLRFGQYDPPSGFTISGSPSGSSPSGDDGTSAAVGSLPGPVSVSTDRNNPTQVPEASAATVRREADGEAENSLITALVATFAVLATTLVVLLGIIAVMGAVRRRRKKEWLKYSGTDLMASSDVRP